MVLSDDTKNRLGIGLALQTAGAEVAVAIDANTTANALATAELASGLDSANVATVATGNIAGAIPLIYMFTLAAGALADTDIIVTQKIRVIDAWLVLQGAGVSSTTITVKNLANAISSAMAGSGSDTALVRTTTIDDAQHVVSAGGTLRVTSAVGASQPACTVYVSAVRVP